LISFLGINELVLLLFFKRMVHIFECATNKMAQKAYTDLLRFFLALEIWMCVCVCVCVFFFFF
jgi:hypothetical protein